MGSYSAPTIINFGLARRRFAFFLEQFISHIDFCCFTLQNSALRELANVMCSVFAAKFAFSYSLLCRINLNKTPERFYS